jgi:hypothetical protein
MSFEITGLVLLVNIFENERKNKIVSAIKIIMSAKKKPLGRKYLLIRKRPYIDNIANVNNPRILDTQVEPQLIP